VAELSTAVALRWGRGILAGFGLLAIVGLLVLAARGCGSDASPEPFDFHTDRAPAEYLYIDLPRVGAYLSQVEGGLASAEKQVRSVAASGSLGVTASGITGNVGGQRQATSERVVSATEASLFLGLRDKLMKRGRIAVIDTDTDHGGPRAVGHALRKLAEGQFVELRNVNLRVPDYLLPYLVLQYPTPRPKALIQLPRGERKDAQRYLDAVGKDPRLMLTWEACDTCFKLLFPVRYGFLTDEWSLYSGGTATIVGKLTRRVVADGDEYVDVVVRSEFERSASFVPKNALRDFFALDRADLRSSLDDAVRITGGHGFRNGAVILPVAVFT